MFLCHSTQHQVVKLHCMSLNPAFFSKSPLSPWKLAVLPSPGVLLEMQHPKSCPCFGAPWAGSGWAGSRGALVTGEHWEVWAGAGGEWKGALGKVQANGEGIRQGSRTGAGGAEPRTTREQAGSRQRCWNRHSRQFCYGCNQDSPPVFLLFQF